MSVSMRTLAAVIVSLMCVSVPLWAQAPQPTPSGQAPRNQGEYIPIDQLPPQDQLPAAPLLIAAYSFVLIVFFLYVVSLARRLTSVQRDVDRLGATLKQSSKP
jgi:hypothetical protein